MSIDLDEATVSAVPTRTPITRSVLMCKPEFFTVVYRINPWMDPALPTDTSLAVAQWQTLYDTYVGLGFDVHLIDPIDGLPDMVYAANGGFVIDNIAYGAKFTYAERQPEGPAYMDWFREADFDVREPVEINEGEGDFLLVGDVILAGTGLPHRVEQPRRTRRDLRPRGHHAEPGQPELLPPRHRHRGARPDAADGNIAYLPSAFDEPSLADSAHALPGRHHRHRRGRRDPRPQLLLRRLQRGHRLPGEGLRAPAARARLQPDRRRPVRAAARRRRREVLHAGVAALSSDPLIEPIR